MTETYQHTGEGVKSLSEAPTHDTVRWVKMQLEVDDKMILQCERPEEDVHKLYKYMKNFC